MTEPAFSPCDIPGVQQLCGVPATVAGGVFDTMAAEFGRAATSVLEALLRVIDSTTSVDVTAAWFAANYRTVSRIGLSALLLLFFVQLISSAIQRKPGGLARAVVGTGKAVLGTAILLSLTESALLITDNVSNWIAGSGEDPTRRLLTQVFPAAALPTTGGALLLVGSLLTLIAAFVLWAVLLFRKVAIYLVLVFAPVAFAGQAWEGSRTWAKRLLHALAALILCKVVIVTVFVLGASVAAYGDALSNFLAGLILLGVACFAPWMTFRFLHFLDLAVAHDHYTMLRTSPVGSPVRTASGAMDRVQRLAAVAAPVFAGGAGAGAAVAGAGAARAASGASASAGPIAAAARGGGAAAPAVLTEGLRRAPQGAADRLEAVRPTEPSPPRPASPPPLGPQAAEPPPDRPAP